MKKVNFTGPFLWLALTFVLIISLFPSCDNSLVDTINEDTAERIPVILLRQNTELFSNSSGIFDFGDVAISEPLSVEFTITNIGDGDLRLEGEAPIVFTGEDADLFSISGLTGTLISPDDMATFTVIFSPTAIGSANTTMTIFSNTSDSGEFSIQLSGLGISLAPAFMITSNDVEIENEESLDFGHITVGTHKTMDFTIQNKGALENLNLITNPPVILTDNSAFTVSQPSLITLPAGGQSTFQITFSPPDAVAYSTTIFIQSNDPDAPLFSLDINGTGSRAEIAVIQSGIEIPSGSPDPKHVGEVLVGEENQTTFTIQNTGFSELILTGDHLTGDQWIEIKGDDASQFSITESPLSEITPQDSTSFVLNFAPESIGEKYATLSIENNDSDESPYTIGIVGEGLEPELSIYINSVPRESGVGTVYCGSVYAEDAAEVSTGLPVVVTIVNEGTSSLDFSAFTFTQGDTDDFIFYENPESIIAAGESTTFSIVFDPLVVGGRWADLTLFSNDRDESEFIIRFDGSGIKPEIELRDNEENLLDGDNLTFNFGTTIEGLAMHRQFSIYNLGIYDLELTGSPDPVILSGPGMNHYSITQQPDSLIPCEEYMPFVITCEPQGSGVLESAYISIPSNDSDEGNLVIELLATAQGTVSKIELPVTGQTTSYAAGDDGDLQKGIAWPVPRFVNHGNGTITDNLTGLIWEQTPPTSYIDWTPALTRVMNLSTGGYTDWRMPNIVELASLIHCERNYAMDWLNTAGFVDIQIYDYWSSTISQYDNSKAQTIGDIGGLLVPIVRNIPDANLIIAVRGSSGANIYLPATGQTTSYAAGDDGASKTGEVWPEPRFLDVGDGTVLDLLTGLMWERTPSTGKLNWINALQTVNDLDLAGHTDWRLPNLRELMSLINFGVNHTGTWLNGQGFTDVRNDIYWTSTTTNWDSNTAFAVSLYQVCSVGNQSKTDSRYFWAVRDPF